MTVWLLQFSHMQLPAWDRSFSGALFLALSDPSMKTKCYLSPLCLVVSQLLMTLALVKYSCQCTLPGLKLLEAGASGQSLYNKLLAVYINGL